MRLYPPSGGQTGNFGQANYTVTKGGLIHHRGTVLKMNLDLASALPTALDHSAFNDVGELLVYRHSYSPIPCRVDCGLSASQGALSPLVPVLTELADESAPARPAWLVVRGVSQRLEIKGLKFFRFSDHALLL